VLLQAIYDIIGNAVAFFFAQPFAESAHKFARASQRKSDGEAQHVPTGAHPRMRTDREQLSIWGLVYHDWKWPRPRHDSFLSYFY
jgi:hypothetical protein